MVQVPITEFPNEWTLMNRIVCLYKFTHVLKYPKFPYLGVTHVMEIAFVFGKPFYPPMHPEKTEEKNQAWVRAVPFCGEYPWPSV